LTLTDSLSDLLNNSLFKEPLIELTSFSIKSACLVSEIDPPEDPGRKRIGYGVSHYLPYGGREQAFAEM